MSNKVAIIVGSGAVENAWEPVLKAFRNIWGEQVDENDANFLFAKQIYLLRIYAGFNDDLSKKNLQTELEQVNDLKEFICHYLSLYQINGLIKPRKEFVKVLDKFVFCNRLNKFSTITTNWDTVIDKKADEVVQLVYDDLESAQCFHIHGRLDNPRKLYLPSEISKENYRSEIENREFGLISYETLQYLKQANQIVLYGISLDPLDAELNQILSTTFSVSKALQEIIIVNPDSARLRKRVEYLVFPRKGLQIKCFHPLNLDVEV
jgi:hypothetical protein